MTPVSIDAPSRPRPDGIKPMSPARNRQIRRGTTLDKEPLNTRTKHPPHVAERAGQGNGAVANLGDGEAVRLCVRTEPFAYRA